MNLEIKFRKGISKYTYNLKITLITKYKKYVLGLNFFEELI